MRLVKQAGEAPGQARDYWEARGITAAVARAARLEGLTPEATRALGQSFQARPSLLIPYLGLDGKPTGFYRVRYLGEPPANSWASMVVKPQRFAQAPDTLNEAYLPATGFAWADIARDPTLPLILTEGEIKALACAARNFACIGLGGVDCWRSSKRGITLLPTLEAFDWGKREVKLVYDSDAAHNPNVARAMRQLAEELTRRGAKAAIIVLPPGKGGEKVGLDDYLLTHSDEEFQTLLADALPWGEANALHELNEEVVLSRRERIVIERATGEKMRAADFTKLLYANREYAVPRYNGKGEQTGVTMKSLPERWVKWPARAEVSRITYLPGKPLIHEGQWNLWTGLGVEPVAGDITPWMELMDYFFGLKPKAELAWFQQWCAYPLQHLGTKLYSAVVIWGTAQGTGKTLIGKTLQRIYGENGATITSEMLRGEHNGWLEGKQFILGEEITGSDNRKDADKLKQMITQDEASIRRMYLDHYTIPDFCNYLFTSNHPDAFFMDDDDRRHFVCRHEAQPKSLAWYRSYDKWFKGDGAGHLLHHFLNLDLKGFDPTGPAMRTEDRGAMIRDTRSDLSAWLHDFMEDPKGHLHSLGQKIAEGCDLFTSAQLLALYSHDRDGQIGRTTAGGVARELSRMRCFQVGNGEPMDVPGGKRARFFAVRNPDKWRNASRGDCAAHIREYYPALPSRSTF